MARIRSLKPEMWQSLDFVSLSTLGRLAFIALISNADDEGRLRTDAHHIAKAYLSGVSPAAVDKQLLRMESNGMITRYGSEGHPCIAISSWSAHQRIDRPSPSRIPAPPNSPSARRTLDDDSDARARADRSERSTEGPTDQPAHARQAGDNSADGGRIKESRGRGDLTPLRDSLSNIRTA